MKTFIGYDKNGERVRGYMLEHYNFEELKQYMTLADFEKIEYIQELRYDQKTTRLENGELNHDTSVWKYDTKAKKYYIHK